MNRYKVGYEDHFNELHYTEIEANSEEEAINKFENHSNELLISIHKL